MAPNHTAQAVSIGMMTRPSRRCAACLTVPGLLVLSVALAAQTPQFEVSSIRRNSGNELRGDQRQLPDGTVITTNISMRNLLSFAWPSEDLQIQNLPDWAMRSRYDVIVKPPAGASPAQIQEMWQALFKDRLKLEAHNETYDAPSYALVVARADGRLGPQIRPSPHDCAAIAAAQDKTPAPPRATLPSEDEVMSTCGRLFLQGRTISGGMRLATLASSLRTAVGRLVEDRTGLDGYYALTLSYAAPPRPGEAPAVPGDAPSIFTALQEQLGLKLEPARKQMQTVVIDHIEPPTEN